MHAIGDRECPQAAVTRAQVAVLVLIQIDRDVLPRQVIDDLLRHIECSAREGRVVHNTVAVGADELTRGGFTVRVAVSAPRGRRHTRR